MLRAVPMATLVSSVLIPPGALALETAFGRCREIAEANARLACYDAIPFAAPRAGAAAAGTPAASTAAASAASATAATPAGTARTAEAAPAAPSAADRFGLAAVPAAQELQSIASSVESDFFGWGPNERIRLLNGQVWEVVDGSSGTVAPANRKVVVRRGALGSYFLEFEGLNRSPRVRRLR